MFCPQVSFPYKKHFNKYIFVERKMNHYQPSLNFQFFERDIFLNYCLLLINMIKLIIFLFYLQIVISQECGVSPSVERYSRIFGGRTHTKRILGGDVSREKDWPWLVAIEFNHGEGIFACTGSIIHEHWVLIAAHCATKGENRPDSFLGKIFNRYFK